MAASKTATVRASERAVARTMCHTHVEHELVVLIIITTDLVPSSGAITIMNPLGSVAEGDAPAVEGADRWHPDDLQSIQHTRLALRHHRTGRLTIRWCVCVCARESMIRCSNDSSCRRI